MTQCDLSGTYRAKTLVNQPKDLHDCVLTEHLAKTYIVEELNVGTEKIIKITGIEKKTLVFSGVRGDHSIHVGGNPVEISC